MTEVKCDICGKVITSQKRKGKTTEVTIQKGGTEIKYDCCSVECEQELFDKLKRNWLRNYQSGN